MFKKIISVLLCILIAISMVACNNNTNSDPTTNPSTPPSSDPTEPTQLIEIDKPLFSDKDSEKAIYESPNLNFIDMNGYEDLYPEITDAGTSISFGLFVLCGNDLYRYTVDDNNAIQRVLIQVSEYKSIVYSENEVYVFETEDGLLAYCCDEIKIEEEQAMQSVITIPIDGECDDIVECDYDKEKNHFFVIFRNENSVIYREYDTITKEITNEYLVACTDGVQTSLINDMWVSPRYRAIIIKVGDRLYATNEETIKIENEQYIIEIIETTITKDVDKLLTQAFDYYFTTTTNNKTYMSLQPVLAYNSKNINLKMPNGYTVDDIHTVYSDDYHFIMIMNDNAVFVIDGSNIFESENSKFTRLLEDEFSDKILKVVIEGGMICVLMDDGKFYEYY